MQIDSKNKNYKDYLLDAIPTDKNFQYLEKNMSEYRGIIKINKHNTYRNKQFLENAEKYKDNPFSDLVDFDSMKEFRYYFPKNNYKSTI